MTLIIPKKKPCNPPMKVVTLQDSKNERNHPAPYDLNVVSRDMDDKR